MARILPIVIVLLGWSIFGPLAHGQDHQPDAKEQADATRVEVELLDFDDYRFRVKGPNGKRRSIPMDQVEAYRTKDGVPQIRLQDGTLLILPKETPEKFSSFGNGVWHTTSRKRVDGRFSLPSFSNSFSRDKGKEAFDKSWKAAQCAFSKEMPAGELALAGAAAIVNIASLICFLILIVVMFNHGSITTGILCLLTTCCCGIGPLIALFSGWANAALWGITKLMTVYTLLMVLGFMLGVARMVLYPETFAEINATAYGCPG